MDQLATQIFEATQSVERYFFNDNSPSPDDPRLTNEVVFTALSKNPAILDDLMRIHFLIRELHKVRGEMSVVADEVMKEDDFKKVEIGFEVFDMKHHKSFHLRDEIENASVALYHAMIVEAKAASS